MKTTVLLCMAFLTFNSSLAAQGISGSWNGAWWVWDRALADQTQDNGPRFVRRTFDLPAKFDRAELRITADNHYVVHVNGQKVGEDGEWNSVEKYDVAKLLAPGKNVLAIQAKNQGGVAGVIARLHMQTADKKDIVIGTDQHARITRTPPPTLSGEGTANAWLKPDFDDSKWSAAIVLGDASIGPWKLDGSTAVAAKPGMGYDVSAVDPKIKTRLSAAEQLKHFVFPEGFEVELVADDPLVINPITLAMDDDGRLYVSESHTYRYGPGGSPIKPFANPVIRLDPLPDGKGFKRTLVAEGFADPVMGMALRDNKLWLTANNYLYQYNVPASPLGGEGPGVKGADNKPLAIHQKIIAVDKNKAWNPFGMFVVEFGPDGLLYMSVGNHSIDIQGPPHPHPSTPGGEGQGVRGKISGRGSSGIVMRMNPDGTKMERLVHGLRVPYSFDYDPFGQLWLLSNGEGNPNRFVRVIDGVDYHCYSRGNVDNNWLAGKHPLAPPCIELHRGANTQLMRYYGAAFPESYQGSLFLDNWGAHGFAGPNRAIVRFVPDKHGNIIHKEPLLSCTDPHFRPSHILLDVDGNLLVADWYGRDDESDMTGRIWRLKYKGKARPNVAPDWSNDESILDALGSPNHLVRAKAVRELVKKGPPMIDMLARSASEGGALAAAGAHWTLLQIGTPAAKAALASGAKHPDWKVRRLAINLLRRYAPSPLSPLPQGERGRGEGLTADVARQLGADKEVSVRVEAALALATPADIRAALIDALENGAAADDHLRYEAAWHLARHADLTSLNRLLSSTDAQVRLAGLIAVDVACYEDFVTRPIALAALSAALENTAQPDHELLLTVANLNGDATVLPALEKLVMREDLPLATTAKAILVLKSKAGGLKGVNATARKRLIEAVEKGSVRIATPSDQLVLFEFLDAEGPTPFALNQVGSQLRSNQPAVRQAAHVLARKFGGKASSLAETLWVGVNSPTAKAEDAVELLSTLARVESPPKKEPWTKLLAHPQPLVRTEAIRWWRNFKGKPEMVDVLMGQVPALLKSDPGLRDDLGAVLHHLDASSSSVKTLDLPAIEKDKAALTKIALEAFAAMPAADRQKSAILGQQVFERSACTKCHTTATQTTPLAPSLKGIAAQKLDYLIESVLYPSKIIKTGFETETVVTSEGKLLSGLVKEEGNMLRVLNLDHETRIAKADVEGRSVSRISIMPEGQEAQMSRREFVDLIAFLATLK